MKALIVGDYHDRSLKGTLDLIIKNETPTHLISLGDFDIISSIEEFIEIAEDCRRKGIEVIDVPGNHDHAIINNIYINSPSLRMLRKSIYMLHDEIQRTPKAKSYIENLLKPENIIRRIRIGAFRAAVVHGAYAGDSSSSSLFPEEMYNNLWYRLLNASDAGLNFRGMKAMGENLMIRGHDHDSVCIHEKNKVALMDYRLDGGTVTLGPRSLQVISTGAFCDGNYAVLETINNRSQLKARFMKF